MALSPPRAVLCRVCTTWYMSHLNQPGFDRWASHRAALSAVLGRATPSAANTVCLAEAFAGSAERAAAFLGHHGLGGWWHESISAQGAKDDFARQLEHALAHWRRAGAMLQLAQESAMRAVAQALDARGVRFVFLKAAAVRAELYQSPGLRPATDIDMLVHPADRVETIEALGVIGATPWARQAESAHEMAFRLGVVDIDLHWDLLAPGRLRGEVAARVLQRRVPAAIGWRPDDTDVLFVSLVHLAFAKHVCSAHAGLNRVADTCRALRLMAPDLNELECRVREAGCAAAAWASVTWILMLVAPTPVISSDPTCAGGIELSALRSLERNLRPRRPKDAYLALWLQHDWPGRLLNRQQWLVQIAFSLFLHDSPLDAVRAIQHKLMRPNLSATAPDPA